MKFKVKNTVTKEKEVDIELPYFAKSICYYYKVISEDNIIQVCDSSCMPGISVSRLESVFSEGNKRTTEKQFNDAYARVLKKITP